MVEVVVVPASVVGGGDELSMVSTGGAPPAPAESLELSLVSSSSESLKTISIANRSSSSPPMAAASLGFEETMKDRVASSMILSPMMQLEEQEQDFVLFHEIFFAKNEEV